jgi:folate-binding protein YgfZ
MRQTADQYRTFAAGSGWIDRRARGRLRFDGADATRFLQALITNDVQTLESGRGLYAAYLTPQGRMIADMKVHHRAHDLLVEVADGLGPALAARFDQLIFAEDVRVSDVSASLAQLTVFGEAAPAVLGHAFSIEPIDPDRLRMMPVLGHLDAGRVMIARTDEVDLPAYDLFFETNELEAVRGRLEEMGALAAGQDALDAFRIDAARPAFGVDMTEATIPLEAGLLDRAISTSKGCYVGQEVIIRVLHRGGGRVAKRLVKLEFEESATIPPAPETPIVLAGAEVGRTTSAAMSPTSDRVIALGYVHRDHAEVGVEVVVAGSGATIVRMAG